MGDPFKAIGRGIRRAFRGKNPFKKKRRAPAPAAQQQAIIARNHAQTNAVATPLIVPPWCANPFGAAPAPAPLVVPGPPPLHAPPGFAIPHDAEDDATADEASSDEDLAPSAADNADNSTDDTGGWVTHEDGSRSLSIPGEDAHDPSRRWHQHGEGTLKTHGLPSMYHGEQHHAAFRGENYLGAMAVINTDETLRGAGNFVTDVNHFATHYMSPEEQAQHAISFAEGRLVRGGKLLDTQANEQTVDANDAAEYQEHFGLERQHRAHVVPKHGDEVVVGGAAGHGTVNNSGRGKHIFVMTPAGELRAVDPWAAKTVTPNPTGSTLNFVNHSSLVAGDEVAGAGELTVADGELQQVSDISGHYKPDGVLMRQVLSRLSRDVDVSNVDVKLGGKGNDAQGHEQGPLIAPAHEFLSHDPKEAEKLMRARRRNLDADLERQLAYDPRFRAHAMAMAQKEDTATKRSDHGHELSDPQSEVALAAARRARGLE